MIWALVVALALLCFALIVFVLKAPRGTREAVAAALLLGIAGYVTQGSPSLPASPRDGVEGGNADAGALVEARLRVTNRGVPPNEKWVVVADGLARNGRFAEAAEVLRGATRDNPASSDAWLAMANALMGHADGMLTPAALYAYRRASLAEPDNPGPPFFLGLALLQQGRIKEGRALWTDLLKRAPSDAPWRAALEQQLGQVDSLLRQQR